MSTATTRSSRATRVVPLRPPVVPAHRWLLRLFDALSTWRERARQRHQLMQLDDEMLRDIGLGRADVAAETAKPFWRP